MSVDFNKSEDFVKEFKIFNDGKAGVVENVKVRIEKKAAGEDEKKPVYKLIAEDALGEVNEGFYYQVPDKEGKINGFNNYQAQKLIMLAKGVMGDDVKFPTFNSPTEALDGVMQMVAPHLSKKPWRVVVCYGTTKKKSAYLNFRSFGSFIQPMSVENTLTLGPSDSIVKGENPKATDAAKLVSEMTPGGNPKNLDWMNE